LLTIAAIILVSIASGSPPPIAWCTANISGELLSLSDDELDDSSNEREDANDDWDGEAIEDSVGNPRDSRRRNALCEVYRTLRANAVEC
jgi:hypothetical protein